MSDAVGRRPSAEAARSRIIASIVAGGLGVLALAVSSSSAAARASVARPLSTASLMAKVRHYAAAPDHLSGTARSYAVTDWVSRQLRADGMTLGRQAFGFPRFQPRKVSLSVGTVRLPARAIAPLYYSGQTGAAGVSAPLVDGGTGTFDAATVRGKIVVVSVSYIANAVAVGLYPAIEAARKDGAKALIAVSHAPADDPRFEDTDARGGAGHLPVLILGAKTGRRVTAAADAGRSARLTLQVRGGRACDRDVWGVLPGRSPRRRVIIGTPVSSYVPAASERGGGIAVLLDLARHYAGLPRSKRPETLVFLATSGHEVGFLGLPALIAARRAWFTGADAYVHLGASLGSPEMTERPGGGVTVTRRPDPSGSLYDSENPLLAAVPAAFARAGATLTSTPPHVHITGEQAYAYHAGVPVVSFSGSSLYFHTAGDRPGTVDPALLRAEAIGFRRTIDAIAALRAGRLRGANRQAVTYGRAVNPDPTLQSGSGPQSRNAVRPIARCQ